MRIFSGGSITSRIQLGSTDKYQDKTVYKVTCDGACQNVKIQLELGSGLANLYAKQGTPPILQDISEQPSLFQDWYCLDCDLCQRSGISQSEDGYLWVETCGPVDIPSGFFYITIVAKPLYSEAVVLLDGMGNLKVEKLDDYSCSTLGWAWERKPCVFPFTWHGTTYHGCIKESNANSNNVWCSTKVDPKGNHVTNRMEWGYCGTDCPEQHDTFGDGVF